MDPDEYILHAFRHALPAEGLYILEGHPERNEFRIVPAEEAFTQNLTAFAHNFTTGFMYLGIFTSPSHASDYIFHFRDTIRDEHGKRLFK